LLGETTLSRRWPKLQLWLRDWLAWRGSFSIIMIALEPFSSCQQISVLNILAALLQKVLGRRRKQAY
jgi:lauroyl/myristoyl acyltransferase